MGSINNMHTINLRNAASYIIIFYAFSDILIYSGFKRHKSTLYNIFFVGTTLTKELLKMNLSTSVLINSSVFKGRKTPGR